MWHVASHSMLSRLIKIALSVFILLTIVTIIATIVSKIKHIEKEQSYLDSNIDTQFAYIEDQPTLTDINALRKNDHKFINVQQQDIPFSLGNLTYWIKVTLENKTQIPIDVVLHIDNNQLDELLVYQQNSKKSLDTNYADDSSYIKRSIKSSLFPTFNALLAPQIKQVVYLKLKTDGPPNIPFSVYQKSTFNERSYFSLIIFGGFIGIILLMVIYNLVLFAALKDVVYIFYIGYLFCTLAVTSKLHGFDQLIFSDNIQTWLSEQFLFIHYYLVSFLLLFTLHFLHFQRKHLKFYKLGITTFALLVVISFVASFYDFITQTKLFFSIQPIVYILLIALVLLRIKQDFSWARFYFISWLPLLLAGALQPLMLLNLIDYSFFLKHAFLLGVLAEIAFMSFALAERVRQYEISRLHELSYHAATNLPRRTMLDKAVNDYHNTYNSLSILMIRPTRIERLKSYANDNEINQLFITLSNKLQRFFSPNNAILPITEKGEKVGYIDGNCLAIIINQSKNSQSYQVLCQSIQTIICENYQIKSLSLPLSAEIGIAQYPEQVSIISELIDSAKLTLESAENTPNKWATYKQNTTEQAEYILTMAADLKSALENESFELFHQPQIDLKTLRVCGSECLIRWKHPTHGNIPPDIFIPIAEDLGLITPLTYWVVENALKQHTIITTEYKYNHMISINISGKDIVMNQFYDNILAIIERSEISPEKIIFEITESASVANSEHAIEVLDRLTNIGITISIDDFGTGYSTMAHLDKLPFQELKIDRQFVQDVCDSNKRRSIAKASVEMAKGLGFEVVAEGINSVKDQDTLSKFGCDIGQGYFYSKPLPLTEYLQWLEVENNGKAPDDFYGEYIPASKNKT